jgi:hypothetical protein
LLVFQKPRKHLLLFFYQYPPIRASCSTIYSIYSSNVN